MTKKELVQEIKTNMAATGITTLQIEETLTHAFDLIREAAHHKPVKLKGFGVFKMLNRKARTGRNPMTGERVEIPARSELKFKASA